MSETRAEYLARKSERELSMREFRARGLLQEVNRLFFHPLGLSLELYPDEDGEAPDGPTAWISVTATSDPLGYIHGDLTAEDAARGKLLRQQRMAYGTRRKAAYGWAIEPLP